MKVVLDTNVLVSGLLSPYGRPAEIVRMVSSTELRLCFDARILSEYSEVLRRPKFQFDEEKVETILDHIERCGSLVAPSPLSSGLPDPDDEPFLAVAIAARADCLVTGNSAHFPRDRCEGITVYSPASFLRYFKSQGG